MKNQIETKILLLPIDTIPVDYEYAFRMVYMDMGLYVDPAFLSFFVREMGREAEVKDGY